MPLMTELTMSVKGRDYLTGLPKTIEVNSNQILEAIQDSINEITDIVKQTLEKTPPELASDIVQRGIVLCGGGALIREIDKLLSKKTDMPVYIAENPMESVVKGTEKTLDDLENLRNVLIDSRRR